MHCATQQACPCTTRLPTTADTFITGFQDNPRFGNEGSEPKGDHHGSHALTVEQHPVSQVSVSMPSVQLPPMPSVQVTSSVASTAASVQTASMASIPKMPSTPQPPAPVPVTPAPMPAAVIPEAVAPPTVSQPPGTLPMATQVTSKVTTHTQPSTIEEHQNIVRIEAESAFLRNLHKTEGKKDPVSLGVVRLD